MDLGMGRASCVINAFHQYLEMRICILHSMIGQQQEVFSLLTVVFLLVTNTQSDAPQLENELSHSVSICHV